MEERTPDAYRKENKKVSHIQHNTRKLPFSHTARNESTRERRSDVSARVCTRGNAKGMTQTAMLRLAFVRCLDQMFLVFCIPRTPQSVVQSATKRRTTPGLTPNNWNRESHLEHRRAKQIVIA